MSRWLELLDPTAGAWVFSLARASWQGGLATREEAALAHRSRRPAANDPAAWLFLLWGTGAVTFLARLGILCRESRTQRRTAVPVDDPALAVEFQRVCRLLQVDRPPALLESRAVPAPMLTGIRKPAVVLPKPGPSAGTEDARLMLAHEIAHLRRADLRWAWLPTLARCLFFFHPAVWLAHREWVAATEAACDELVLTATGAAPARYATMLLTVATRWGDSAGSSPTTVSVVGYQRSLRRRIQMLRTVRPASPTRLRRAALVVALLGPAVLVPWRVVASPAQAIPPAAAERAAKKDETVSRPKSGATPRPAQVFLPPRATPKPPRPDRPVSMAVPPPTPAVPPVPMATPIQVPMATPIPAPLPPQAVTPPALSTTGGNLPATPGRRKGEGRPAPPNVPPASPATPAPTPQGTDKPAQPPTPPGVPDAPGNPVLENLPVVGRLFRSQVATGDARRTDAGALAKDLVVTAYRLQQIESADLRQLLFQESGIPSGITTIVSDRRANTLIIRGTPEGTETLKLGIALGDVRVEAEGETFKVHLKPAKVDAATLQKRVLGLIGSGGASIANGVVALRGNREWVLRSIGLAMSLEMGGIERGDRGGTFGDLGVGRSGTSAGSTPRSPNRPAAAPSTPPAR